MRTIIPGEGDEFSRREEIEMFNAKLRDAALGQRRSTDAQPIGRRILEAEVFGTEAYLAPFEFPEPHFPIRRFGSQN